MDGIIVIEPTYECMHQCIRSFRRYKERDRQTDKQNARESRERVVSVCVAFTADVKACSTYCIHMLRDGPRSYLGHAHCYILTLRSRGYI